MLLPAARTKGAAGPAARRKRPEARAQNLRTETKRGRAKKDKEKPQRCGRVLSVLRTIARQHIELLSDGAHRSDFLQLRFTDYRSDESATVCTGKPPAPAGRHKLRTLCGRVVWYKTLASNTNNTQHAAHSVLSPKPPRPAVKQTAATSLCMIKKVLSKR